MSSSNAWLALALALLAPLTARADALPSCPPGTHMVMRPAPPGAMHHGGGGCVPDDVLPEAPPSDPSSPTPPAAPVATPPSEAPPATPEAALPTAPAAAPAVPAPAPPAAEAPSSSRCTASSARGSRMPLGLGLLALALLARRRR